MSEPIHQAAAAQAQTADSGRDASGRFAPGNAGGPGNPFTRQVAALRKAMLNHLTLEDIRAITAKLVEMAKGGDVAAAKLLLSYVIGKPKPAPEPDHLDVEEWEHLKATAFMVKDLPRALGPGPDLPLTVARTARPGMSSGMTSMLAECLKEPQRLPELMSTMFPGDAQDIEVAPAPSGNGVNRLKRPSTNGNKRPSGNGKAVSVGS